MAERLKTSALIDRGVLEIGDGYRAKNSELKSTGIPFARAANINSGFQFSDADRFPVEDLGKCGSKISQPGDVVFTSKGSVGRFAFVSSNTEQFVYSPQLCFWRSLDSEVIDPAWLYYWMYGPEFQNQIGYLKTQTDMAEYVSLRDQRAMSITLPPVTQQRAIAAPLLLLDQKIELNRQTARTLEELAQRLFKSWFVDFDPVRAKMAGRKPAHTPPEIADLFPDRLVDSPLGPIPKGWDVVGFSEEFDFTMGQSPPGSTYNKTGEGQLFFQGKADFGDFFPSNRVYCTQPTRLANAMDVLFSVRAPVGAINLAFEDCAIGRGVCAIRHRLGSVGVSWCWVKEIASHIEGLSGEGALFKSLSKKQLTSVPVIRKPDALLAAAAPLFDEFVEKLSQLELETRTLTKLRDRLLPKLISGEIRVPEAQEMAEESIS